MDRILMLAPTLIETPWTTCSTHERFVLLDRDGVLNVAIANGYVMDESMLELLPGAAEGVAALNRAGYGVIVISNQQCVGKGLLSLDGLRQLTETMCARIRDVSGGSIDAVYYCPHLRDAGCACRKPLPGMILAARERFGFDLANTYFVGDSYSDLKTAKAARCPAIFALSGLEAERHRAGEPFPVEPAHIATDLREAAAYILGQHQRV